MARRTQTLMVLPWTGSLVTSLDESLLQPGDMTIADNIVVSFSDEKPRREGIDYNWDDTVFQVTARSSTGTVRTLKGTFTDTGIKVGDLITIAGAENDNYNIAFTPVLSISSTEITYTGGNFNESEVPETGAYWNNKVVGGIDYWFGSEDAKAQWLVSVLDNGAVYYATSGTKGRLTDVGSAWAAPLTEANLEVYQNRVVIAVSGLNNNQKYWDGDVTSPLQDLPALLYDGANRIVSVSRSSAGTTRTIVFSHNVPATNGDKIIILGGPADYRGSYTLASGGGTTTITYEAADALTESSTPDVTMNIGQDAPFALFLRAHAGALFCNDKTRLDRLHYNGEDLFAWNGLDGLSGATDVGDGDGDPSGLTGISPTLKSTLFVGKRTKLYRIDIPGGDFDNLTQTKISDGIGFISHQGITAIDQDDIFFVSDRGIHSIAATDAYGDFVGTYISAKIQRTFVDKFTPGRKRYIKSAYIPEINSAVFSVSEGGSGTNNMLYLYNIVSKMWYRWPNIEIETIISAQDTDRRRLYLGTYRGRLAQTQTSQSSDTFFNGEAQTILNRISTGLIFPDSRPDTLKHFKSIRLIFKASGSYTITCKVKIDNFSEQSVSFVSNESAVPLGTMVLGSDVLGGSFVTAPYSLPIDGLGRGIKLTIEQNDLNTSLALQGFMIEYFTGQAFQETRLGDDK